MTEQATEQSRLAILYELSSQLGTTLDLSEVLNQVMDAIIKLTSAERGFLMLFNEVTGELETMAARNVDEKAMDSRASEISRTVVERAAKTGKGIVTNNAQEDERFSGQQSVVGFQLRSIMCAPLRARGRTLGAVYVDNRFFTNIFKDEDLELLATFANQAAIAIENAKLFTLTDQALARRVAELSLFQQIDQELNRSLDLDRVLSLALDWAIRLTTAEYGSIGLMEQMEEPSEEYALRLLFYKGGEDVKEPALIHTTHPILSQILAENKSLVTRGLTADQAFDGLPATVQLSVPVRRDGTITGLITLKSQNANALNHEDVEFVERLADRAAVAIKNARLYQDIAAANQAKSDFVSLVTHELRLPMTSIKGYTDLLASGMVGALNEQQMQFIDVVKRNLDRMGALIRDLGDINRIESGRMKFEFEVVDLVEVVSDVVDSLREAVDGRKQTLAVDVSDDFPAVHADPTRLSQIVTNLVSNAHKYTPDEGTIQVVAAHNGRIATISIIDNGLGISEENQEKLFTQFFRAEDREVREQVGWGLGLSIVKKMVEAQGGEISFKSELGQGSTFAFTVPLSEENGGAE
jgi:signal transduction histidine kinase